MAERPSAYAGVTNKLKAIATTESTSKPVGGDLKGLPEAELVPGQSSGFRETLTYLYVDKEGHTLVPRFVYVYNTSEAFQYLTREQGALPGSDRFPHNHPCFLERVVLYHEYNEAIRRNQNPLVPPDDVRMNQIFTQFCNDGASLTPEDRLALRARLDMDHVTAFTDLSLSPDKSELPNIAALLLTNEPEGSWLFRTSSTPDTPLCSVRTLTYKRADNKIYNVRMMHLAGFGYYLFGGNSKLNLPQEPSESKATKKIPEPQDKFRGLENRLDLTNRVFPCFADLIDFCCDPTGLNIFHKDKLVIPPPEAVKAFIDALPRPGEAAARREVLEAASSEKLSEPGKKALKKAVDAYDAIRVPIKKSSIRFGFESLPAGAAVAAANARISMGRINNHSGMMPPGPARAAASNRRRNNSRSNLSQSMTAAFASRPVMSLPLLMNNRHMMEPGAAAASSSNHTTFVPNRGRHAHMMGSLPTRAASAAAPIAIAQQRPENAKAAMEAARMAHNRQENVIRTAQQRTQNANAALAVAKAATAASAAAGRLLLSPSVDDLRVISGDETKLNNLMITYDILQKELRYKVGDKFLIRRFSESSVDILNNNLKNKPNGCFILCISQIYPEHMAVAYVENNDVKHVLIQKGIDEDKRIWWGIYDGKMHWYPTLFELIMKCNSFTHFYLDDNCVVDKTVLFNSLGVPLQPFPRTMEVCVTAEAIRIASLGPMGRAFYSRPGPPIYASSAAAMPGGRRVKRHTRGHKKSRRTRHSKKSRRTRRK